MNAELMLILIYNGNCKVRREESIVDCFPILNYVDIFQQKSYVKCLDHKPPQFHIYRCSYLVLLQISNLSLAKLIRVCTTSPVCTDISPVCTDISKEVKQSNIGEIWKKNEAAKLHPIRQGLPLNL